LIYSTKNQKLSKNDLIVEIILDISMSESEGCMGKLKTSLINFSELGQSAAKLDIAG
tara:strand:+ start:551 stop:721 length:171 start_codon:yes stop_codon:yes gene_type:complete